MSDESLDAAPPIEAPPAASSGAAAAALIRDGSIHGTRPADGQPLRPVAVTSVADLPARLDRAREAQAAHAARRTDERVALLRRFRNAILARAEALVTALCEETGKPEAEAWLHEVVPTADLDDYWGTQGPEHLVREEPALDPMSYPGKRAVVERVPRGVIALVTPWNFPLAIPLRTLFPALLAGDAVLFKPSEHTPRTAALLGEAAREVYGDDLVQVVQGGADVGAGLIEAGVDAVVFTGSVATGRKVAAAAAARLVPVSLELGGKDAAIVLDDADVERTARGILWGAFANAGQNCAAVERVYATPSVVEALRARLATLAKELVPGRDFGPLTNAAQLAIVEEHVRDARAAGAEVLAGGERLDRPGLWYAPTVLGETPAEAAALTDETFGPIVPVVEVADERAAIDAVNSARYGLTASVWTRDLARGERVARALRAGVVVVNNHGFTGAIPSMPWTGVGESGYGVTNSSHALDILTRPRVVVVDARRAKTEMWWHPYTPGLVEAGRSLAVLRSGAGLGAKLRAFFRLLGAFMRRWKT